MSFEKYAGDNRLELSLINKNVRDMGAWEKNGMSLASVAEGG
jgi:hypothetical protein